jgi:hypothetical protein
MEVETVITTAELATLRGDLQQSRVQSQNLYAVV